MVKKQTIRNFDEALLFTLVRKLSPAEIAALRERVGVSQAVFARYLNVTPGLVSQWERGIKHPRGAALKLLTLVNHSGLEGIA